MSSSPEAVVRAGSPGEVRVPSLDTDLRSGTWTRLGDSSILGDGVTESALRTLAETTRAAARAQGYAVGWSEGRRTSELRARESAETAAVALAERETFRAAEHDQALLALRRAAELLEQSVLGACAAVEARTVEVAMALAEAIVGRELAVAESPGSDAVRRALALAPAADGIVIRLHPADLSAVDGTELAGTGARLVGDPAVASGDAVVETTDSVVDATVATALTRVREVLTSCTP